MNTATIPFLYRAVEPDSLIMFFRHFRVIRPPPCIFFRLKGPRAGESEVLLDGLPAMPDGITRTSRPPSPVPPQPRHPPRYINTVGALDPSDIGAPDPEARRNHTYVTPHPSGIPPSHAPSPRCSRNIDDMSLDLAFTRCSFTLRLSCTNQPSLHPPAHRHCPPWCSSIARLSDSIRISFRPPVCILCTIQYW